MLDDQAIADAERLGEAIQTMTAAEIPIDSVFSPEFGVSRGRLSIRTTHHEEDEGFE